MPVFWLGSSRPCAVTTFFWPAARVEAAALQHGGGVAEDEVDGAVDVAVAVELAEGVRVQRVLVPREAAAVEGGEVGVHAQRHGLVLAWTRRVLHRQVTRQEARAHHRWGIGRHKIRCQMAWCSTVD